MISLADGNRKKMANANHAEAHKNLGALRDDFERALGGEKDLYNVLVCVSDIDHPRINEAPPVPELRNAPVHKTSISFPDQKNYMVSYYYGSDTKLARFRELASETFRIWTQLYPAIPIVSASEANRLDLGIDWSYDDILTRFAAVEHADLDDQEIPRWVLVVHSLAWRASAASRLTARRLIWHPEWEGFAAVTFPYETAQREVALDAVPPSQRERFRDNPSTPDYFFSELGNGLNGVNLSRKS